MLGATAGPAVESDIALVGDSCSVTWLGDAVVAAVIAATPAERAYPMLSFNFVLVTLAAQLFYGEKATLRHWLGVAAIMFGILLMSWHL